MAPEENKQEEVQTKPHSGSIQREMAPEENKQEEVQTKPHSGSIQREMAPEENKQEEVQAKSLPGSIQRETAPEENKEEEVQTKLHSGSIQRETAPEENKQEEVQAKSVPGIIQRETAPDENKEEEVQTKPSPEGKSQTSSNVESQLSASKGGGSALSDEVRAFMEPRFGADFSGVRVHTDGAAVQMNRELGAQAFAHGNDIYFGAGKSPGKDELTAHELTHVVQQTGQSRLNAKQNNKVNRKSQQILKGRTTSELLQAETRIQRDTKVSGTKAVTPDVAVKVLENMSRGEPPFRPDLSLGGCEWMVSEGNPYVGVGSEKSVNLPVEAMRPANPLIFQEADLVEIFNQKLNQITDAVAEAEYRRAANIPDEQQLTSKQRRTVRGKFKERMAEKAMWEEVGRRVRSSQGKVGEVILQNSRFSKQGNGKFLVVADRTKINVKGGMSAVVEALEKSGASAEPTVAEAARRLISQRNLGRVKAVFRYGGRILIVVAVAAEAYKIYHAQDKVKAVVESAGGWAGASAAAAAFATWFAPADAAGPWAWAAHGVGTLIAGGIGYWIGSETTRTIYELVLEE
ncbi:hypothetical protein MiSe_13330 [Microseira wollei NIES-4236]|uniref:eCIS core domain-containing protein n=2 Tax=Microseira wollei TaxID=467598 RepID=A0AAV3XB43_9CYAN|nr:hypothetical protein MiSe_13330 [Microseira wollei NIES-4236]